MAELAAVTAIAPIVGEIAKTEAAKIAVTKFFEERREVIDFGTDTGKQLVSKALSGELGGDVAKNLQDVITKASPTLGMRVNRLRRKDQRAQQRAKIQADAATTAAATRRVDLIEEKRKEWNVDYAEAERRLFGTPIQPAQPTEPTSGSGEMSLQEKLRVAQIVVMCVFLVLLVVWYMRGSVDSLQGYDVALKWLVLGSGAAFAGLFVYARLDKSSIR